jgi:type II secretory pathway predicted ATPase ExeA
MKGATKASPLLAEFEGSGVSYAVAARDLGLSKSSLHRLLHGETGPNQKQVIPRIERWLKERQKTAVYKTAPMWRYLAYRNITVAEAARALGVEASQAERMIASGEWDSEDRYRKFQSFLEIKKYGEAKKMLTKISLPDEVLAHFQLKRDPFTNEMEGGEDIFDTRELSRAEKKILNAVDKGGFVAITGAVGSGKSTLIKRVEAKLIKRRDVALVKPRTIEKQYLGASHVCDSILEDLGTRSVLSHRTLEYRARLVGRTLEEAYKDNRRVVVLIDEAHLLRPDALLALKRLYEFEIGFKKLLSIILIGQDGLARQLRTNFNLTEVSQRVDLYEIGSLNGSLGAYVRHKLERAGAGRDIFDNSAFKAIGERHDTPLLVNNIAAAALVAAHDLGEKHVTGDIVRSIQGS